MVTKKEWIITLPKAEGQYQSVNSPFMFFNAIKEITHNKRNYFLYI